jgi:hypothetical protein
MTPATGMSSSNVQSTTQFRAGLVRNGSRQRFVQKTYSAGSDHLDLSHTLALGDELEDQERIRGMKLTEKAAERQ